MRSSISATIPYSHRILVLVPFLLFLLITSSISQPQNTMLHVGRSQNSCRRISTELQRVRRCPPFPPPPPPADDGDEIDPRYGVEKRLVPSGPNPLHNWIMHRFIISNSFFFFVFLGLLWRNLNFVSILITSLPFSFAFFRCPFLQFSWTLSGA